MLLFDQKLANLTSYKLTLKDNSNIYNQLSSEAKEFLNKKLLDFYLLTDEDLLQNITKIFELSSEKYQTNIPLDHKSPSHKFSKKNFILWVYKNNEPLALALALNLLTNDYDIDTVYLAKIFNSSPQQVISSQASADKFITYNYFLRDLFSNMHSIEKMADYMLIQFSLTKPYTIEHIIYSFFDSQFYTHYFLKHIYYFINIFELNNIDLVIFLKHIVKLKEKNFELNKAISKIFNLENHKNDKYFKNKREILEQAFTYSSLAKSSKNISYERIKNISNYFYGKLTNFERILYPKKDIKFIFNDNKSSIRYRSDNVFSHKIYLIYTNLIKDHPDLIKDYPSDIIKSMIIMEYLPNFSYKNNVLARILNIDLEKLISIRQLIEKYSLKYNSSSFYVARLDVLDRVIDNDPEYFSLLFKDILEFKGIKPITQPEIIKNLIIDFHDNELKNKIERVLFIDFVLKLKQPNWFSLQEAINLHKKLFPYIIKYHNIFDPDLYKEESLMETLKLTHKIAANFVRYVAYNTEYYLK